MKKFLFLFLFSLLFASPVSADSWVDVPSLDLSFYDYTTVPRVSLSGADSACIALGGRVPTLSELQTIYSNRASISINWITSDTPYSSNYWSSTVAVSPNYYYIKWTTGTQNDTHQDNSCYYVCIKDYVAPPETCTSWTYSDWTLCSGGSQSRTLVTSSPEGCEGGSPVLSQSCTEPTCTSWTYSDWGECSEETLTQSRTVVTSSPEGCLNGVPITSRTCSLGEGIGIISEKDADDISTGLGSILTSLEGVVQTGIPYMINFAFLLIGLSIVVLLLNKGRNAIKKS